ncbi:hypothetical protein POTOM_035832 [Populus tomentosa]|uniref:Uncharacterized protein n=1 Tax=Populus tomentosa TaxID=118781 RepID=A0A8X7YYG3_POPTO|nr:hypothetical protein POTOM_035832 [Populus tomentosa]
MRRKGLKAKSVCGRKGIKDAADLTSSAWLSIRVNRDKNGSRDVVKNLRESLEEDPKDIAEFRRTADAAKESIREYLSSWRGRETVAREICIFNVLPFGEWWHSATIYFLGVHLQESLPRAF